MPRALTFKDSGFTKREFALLKKLDTPAKIQDFLNRLPFDFAPGDEIDRSARGILKNRKVDCAGGAIVAAAALWVGGRPPLLLDLKASRKDVDHVVAVFYEERKSAGGRLLGAISKTNHAVLRYREPLYRDARELVMSYFHEYFLPSGEKTLESFSRPLDLSGYGFGWLTDPQAVVDIIYDLDHSLHENIASKKWTKQFRKADAIERRAGEITEYP